jgi:hypothetical protein
MAAWTYTTLTQALQDAVESDEPTLVSNLPILIRQAEDRILKDVQLPDFRKSVSGSMSATSEYLSIPDDFLGPYSLALDNSGYEYLIFKDVNFIREVYPDSSATGTPRYYSIWDDDYFILGPTPDANYDVELHYFHRPTSITESGDGTSWLGTHAESCLYYACLCELAIFQRADQDVMERFEAAYGRAINQMKLIGEGRNRTDQYRRG